jgi:UDP-2,4-diacetamido-2,4,6-trideoxy-beta-L-altropyranose hydrolase
MRPATTGDAYALWLWANDPETRNASLSGRAIPWIDHLQWLTARLADSWSLVLMGTAEDARPVGCVRFDTQDRWRTARLSYVVAPESRGQGYGTDLVAAGLRYVRSLHIGVAIWAEVKTANERSLRVFRGLGWLEEAPQQEDRRRFWGPEERGMR